MAISASLSSSPAISAGRRWGELDAERAVVAHVFLPGAGELAELGERQQHLAPTDGAGVAGVF